MNGQDTEVGCRRHGGRLVKAEPGMLDVAVAAGIPLVWDTCNKDTRNKDTKRQVPRVAHDHEC